MTTMQFILVCTAICVSFVAFNGYALDLDYPTVLSSGLEVPSAWNLTLTVKASTFSNTALSFLTRLYCYNDECTYQTKTQTAQQ